MGEWEVVRSGVSNHLDSNSNALPSLCDMN